MITPKTKIQEILIQYPELEEMVLDHTPSLKALKSNTLKSMVAKVTTLQQLAITNHLNLNILVNDLSRAAGIEEKNLNINNSMTPSTTKPEWLTPEKDIIVFDVREMLERGEHPVSQVMEELNTLPEKAVYQVIAPFMPIPLIEKATGIGFTHWSDKINDQLFEIYFFKTRQCD